MVAYKELLDEVDACVFTGLMLETDLEIFKEYVKRWNRAIAQHEEFGSDGRYIVGINIGKLTVSEYLLSYNGQKNILEAIKENLRKSNEWGRRGLYVKIGKFVGLSSAHVGQILTGKKNITEHFLMKLIEYMDQK